MVPSNILQRTFYIKYEIYFGTAFTFERNDVQFLATTSHTFPFAQNGEELEISIMHDNIWKPIKIRIYKHKNKQVDIVILRLPHEIGAKNAINLTTAGMFLSQEAFFLGFPYGKFMSDTSYVNAGYPLAYVKHGVFSTLPFKNGDLELMYIDGFNNPGFSGGPCIYMRKGDLTPNVCGLVKGYLPHEVEVKAPLGTFNFEENSGLVEIHSIKHLAEIETN